MNKHSYTNIAMYGFELHAGDRAGELEQISNNLIKNYQTINATAPKHSKKVVI